MKVVRLPMLLVLTLLLAATAVRAHCFWQVARHDKQISQQAGQPFASMRYDATLAFPIWVATSAEDAEQTEPEMYPDLPELVTSFGAAVIDQSLYVYGGHTGGAHAYADNTQARTLRRLDLRQPKAWQSLGDGPGLQGLSLVAHGGKLYRLGGFMAKNKEGEEHDLWSQAEVACYDPQAKQWTNMSPLPDPRSSFDAAVLGDRLYVVGGWQLAGETTTWHTSAHVMDLSNDSPQWQALPAPPFQRRALCVAAHAGRIYVIGGMQEQGGPTTRVDIFDPATETWTEGPSLRGEPMDGFGASAFAVGGRLYASTYSGKLQRLSEDGKSWDVVRQLERARFFHRMLPLSDSQLLVIGGASMQSGKFAELDVINVDDRE